MADLQPATQKLGLISISRIQLMGHTLADHGVSGTDLVRACYISGHTSSLSGLSPKVLILLGGVKFITWHLRHPFLEECQWSQRHFWECRAHLGYSPAPRPTLKKALCYTRRVGETEDKYCYPETCVSCLMHLQIWLQYHEVFFLDV